MADGTGFDIDIGVTGGAAALSAADACAELTSKLTLASQATIAASEAQKAAETAYNQAAVTADRAAKSVERIGIAADAQRGKLQAAMDAGDGTAADRASAKLQNLVARQSEAVIKAQAATAAMNAEAVTLDRLKAAAGSAADNEAKLSAASKTAADAQKSAAKSTADMGSAATGGSGNMRALSSALGKLGGPLGAAGSQAAGFVGAIQKMSKSVGAAGPYIAAAVVIAALTAGVILGALAITKYAVAASDAARTQSLLAAGVARSVTGGVELEAKMAALGATVPATHDELLALAGGLADSGLRGKALADALETAAIKAAKLKYGPDFAKQMLSLDSQSQRLKANVTGIFSGLKIEGLLKGLATLVALFDTTTASGHAMQVLFESVFQPIVDGITGVIPKAVSAFLQFEIYVLKAAIMVKPFGTALAWIAGGLIVVIGLIVGVVLGVLAVLAATIMIPLAALAALAAGIIWLGVQIYDLRSAIVDAAIAPLNVLRGALGAAVDFISSISLVQIGTNLIAGLAQGVTAGASAVVDSVKGVVSGAVDAAKNLLKIHSPSQVFAEIGAYTAEGMAQGVDDGSGGVQDAVGAMVATPDGKAGAGASSGAGGGNTYYVTVQAGGGDAKSIVAALRDFFGDIATEAVATSGAAVPA